MNFVYIQHDVIRIEIINRHTVSSSSYRGYTVGGRGSGVSMHSCGGERISRRYDDMVFFRQGREIYRIRNVEDPSGVERLVKAAVPWIK
jgi:hypothetical protein